MLASVGAADDRDVAAGVGSHKDKGIIITVAVNWAHKVEAFELQQDLARLWDTLIRAFIGFPLVAIGYKHILEARGRCFHIYKLFFVFGYIANENVK